MTTEIDRELREVRTELAQRTSVLVGWARRGGGLIRAGKVRVVWPGSNPRQPAEVTDAELAALRRLELDGEVEVTWPFRAFKLNEKHTPIAPCIEDAAQRLGEEAQRH